MFKLQVHNLFDKSSIQVISWTEPTTRCGGVVNGSAQPSMTYFNTRLILEKNKTNVYLVLTKYK